MRGRQVGGVPQFLFLCRHRRLQDADAYQKLHMYNRYMYIWVRASECIHTHTFVTPHASLAAKLRCAAALLCKVLRISDWPQQPPTHPRAGVLFLFEKKTEKRKKKFHERGLRIHLVFTCHSQLLLLLHTLEDMRCFATQSTSIHSCHHHVCVAESLPRLGFRIAVIALIAEHPTQKNHAKTVSNIQKPA